jgi:hypothetical protein
MSDRSPGQDQLAAIEASRPELLESIKRAVADANRSLEQTAPHPVQLVLVQASFAVAIYDEELDDVVRTSQRLDYVEP